MLKPGAHTRSEGEKLIMELLFFQLYFYGMILIVVLYVNSNTMNICGI
jgi:hypothetical protein